MFTPVRQPVAALPFINLSGYKFVALDDLPARRDALQARLEALDLHGTVLLAPEGINVALAGRPDSALALRAALSSDPAYRELWLKETRSEHVPFRRLKVRIRAEIITFDDSDPATGSKAPHASSGPTAPRLAPASLRDWLDHGRDDGRRPLLLDTRNRYESDVGAFVAGPCHDTAEVGTDHFTEFRSAIVAGLADGTLDREQPVVTYCTGGIRCEKAAPWLRREGFREVWQLDGGILNWFDHCEAAHWRGDCFVFDERVSIGPNGRPSGASICRVCQHVVTAGSTCDCEVHGAESRTAIETV